MTVLFEASTTRTVSWNETPAVLLPGLTFLLLYSWPFVEARVGLVAAAIAELYRVRGFTQAVVKPDIQVLPEAQGVNVRFRPVAIRFEISEGPEQFPCESLPATGVVLRSAGAEALRLLGNGPARSTRRTEEAYRHWIGLSISEMSSDNRINDLTGLFLTFDTAGEFG